MKSQRILAFLVALAAASASAVAADPGARKPAASPIGSGRSDAGAVGKLLLPGPSDPNVPLPDPQLSDTISVDKASSGPRIYGREETGGGVLGLRFPIPVSPGPSGSDTISSSGQSRP